MLSDCLKLSVPGMSSRSTTILIRLIAIKNYYIINIIIINILIESPDSYTL